MSDEDEIGEKSDLTRIEDLSEFLHKDDADVDAALDKSDEPPAPPSLDELPGIDDLESEESIDEPLDFSHDDSEETDFNLDDSDYDSDEDDYSAEDSNFESEESDFSSDDSSFSPEETDFSSSDADFDSSDEFNSPDTSFNSEENDFSSEDTNFDDQDDEISSEEEEEEDDFDNEETDFSSSDSNEEFDEADSSISDFSQDEQIEEDEESLFDNEQEELPESDLQAPDPLESTLTTDSPPSFETPKRHIDQSEKFEDVKSFAKNITYGKISNGGNPPFSIILRNVRFEEDAEDILIILSEHGLLDPSSETAMRQSLEAGSLLISQISEFAAIYLTHKFRRFDLDIQMGLSDELHPSKFYDSDSVGLVSKTRMNQNKNETTRIEKSKVELESILLSTTPTLENFRIVEYLGIVSEFVVIDEHELLNDEKLSTIHDREAKGHADSQVEVESDADLNLGHTAIYQDLSEKLRPKCLKKNGNAIVGINYQITPLLGGEKYKVSCSGSSVWVIDNN